MAEDHPPFSLVLAHRADEEAIHFQAPREAGELVDPPGGGLSPPRLQIMDPGLPHHG
jgi:hypothetical protein